ncbi:MAG: hypothetical protein ACK56I_32715, partial [bacterium]
WIVSMGLLGSVSWPSIQNLYNPCSCYDGPCRKLFLLAMLVLAMLVPAKNFFWSLFLAKNFFLVLVPC